MPFQKGNQEWKKRKTQSPGRPPRPVEEKYHKWLLARVTKDVWIKIVDVAISRAQAGDDRARRFLADWCLGKPVERKELSGPEGGPIETTGTTFDYSVLSDEQLDTLVDILRAAQSRESDGAPSAP